MICSCWTEDGRSRQIFLSQSKLFGAKRPRGKSAERKHCEKVLQAARNSIEEQIVEFRAGLNYNVRCAISGKKLTAGQYDIDHQPSFLELFDRWLEEIDLNVVDLKVKGRSASLRDFHSESLRGAWQVFHRENAKLQVVDRSLNRSAGSKGYRLKRIGNFSESGDSFIPD
jgi:hypothetical protein